MTTKTNELRERRKERLRHKLSQARYGRVRLSVFRSSKQIYAQVIDDQAGKTLAAASSIEKDLRGSLKTGATIEAAAAVDTPAARDAAERDRRQAEAERAIEEDPLVRALMAQYKTARIVPGSVKPLPAP